MIEFEAHLTIGIQGMALTTLEAKLSEGTKPFPDANYTPRDAILNDISCACLEDWYSYSIAPKMPDEEAFGSFVIRGKAWWYSSYDDAELEYSNIKVTA